MTKLIATGRMDSEKVNLSLPSSWAANFPALAEWPEHIYAGRQISGVGHQAAEIPETKVTLPFGDLTPNRRRAQRPYVGPNQRFEDFILRWGNGERP